MTFPDVVVSENPSNEEGECDLNEEIVRLFKTAKLKCKFEIQKIDENNATLVFGVVSGVNISSGESLDIDPEPPVNSTATYKDSVLSSTVFMEGAEFPFNFEIKKGSDGNISFVTKSTISGVNDDGSKFSLPFTLTCQKY